MNFLITSQLPVSVVLRKLRWDFWGNDDGRSARRGWKLSITSLGRKLCVTDGRSNRLRAMLSMDDQSDTNRNGRRLFEVINYLEGLTGIRQTGFLIYFSHWLWTWSLSYPFQNIKIILIVGILMTTAVCYEQYHWNCLLTLTHDRRHSSSSWYSMFDFSSR